MIGDLQSEEERDILVEIEVPKVSNTCSMSVVSCRLSYFNVVTQSDDSAVCDLMIERSNSLFNIHKLVISCTFCYRFH